MRLLFWYAMQTMKFIRVNNALIHGIASIDPKGFHIMISRSQNFRIFNLNLQAPGDSPNTDGIHMSISNLVEISESVIATGDDCVSMIQGSTNISVNKVICGPGHGFRYFPFPYSNSSQAQTLIKHSLKLLHVHVR